MFLGLVNAEDHPPGFIAHDNPRHDHVRNEPSERALDTHVARLRANGDQVVRRPDGHVVTLPAHVELKSGWVRLNASEIDALTLTGADGAMHSERERAHVEIASGSREWRPEPKDEPL